MFDLENFYNSMQLGVDPYAGACPVVSNPGPFDARDCADMTRAHALPLMRYARLTRRHDVRGVAREEPHP